MNLLLLVEGQQTEPRIYREWLERRLPGLQRAENVAGLATNGYVLIQGKGYPSYLKRIAGLLRDLEDNPQKVDHVWVCVDSEELSYEERYEEIKSAFEAASSGTKVWALNPGLQLHIIIQQCCIETWFLGHDGFARAGPQSKTLVQFKRFYDVSAHDPELMDRPPEYVTKASFHLAYLQEMLSEHRHRYRKTSPGVVLEPSYFDALKRRCQRAGHLRSFQKLLAAMDAL